MNDAKTIVRRQMASASAEPEVSGEAKPELRERILAAAFHVLMEQGYAAATTREIAAQARVSKRELYALFGSKQGILAALIESRADSMRMPLAAMADIRTRAHLATALARYGTNLMQAVLQPAPLALFRLAFIDAERSPELARSLDEGGRKANRRALAAFMAAATALGLLPKIEPEQMASRFLALLWGDLLLRVLMRIVDVPQTSDIKARADAAAADFLTLYAAGPERAINQS
jgi:AcrR family transcriptional regulator